MIAYLEEKEGQITREQAAELIDRHLAGHDWKNVLLLPPDITRSHSGAGFLTACYYEKLTERGCEVRIMPALGTHLPMTAEELREMFGDRIPPEAYLVHDFRRSVEAVGVIPHGYVSQISEGLFDRDVPVSVNRELLSGRYDAILSIGQVVPHELAGFAGYTKNLVIGCGGGDMINVSHFLGVFYGRHRIVGEMDTPPRRLFDYAQDHLLNRLPLTFILTVMDQKDGTDICKGLFIGRERDTFEQAVNLSRSVNITYVDRPVKKCVVWMDPHSYHSTWVSNKAIYRTQKAVAEDGEILIIAPGVYTFGENDLADRAIRKYGYRPREEMLKLYQTDPLLSGNLSLAGHLIRSVPSLKTKITYCTDRLTREEVEKANFGYRSAADALKAYPCQNWKTGWRTMPDGEEIYFVRNAALGLWQLEDKETERRQDK
jgi:nickel-dependent lactate racemase